MSEGQESLDFDILKSAFQPIIWEKCFEDSFFSSMCLIDEMYNFFSVWSIDIHAQT